MQKVGESLKEETLEGLTRRTHARHNWADHLCAGCNTNPHPRGWDPHQQLCWFCLFPRST